MQLQKSLSLSIEKWRARKRRIRLLRLTFLLLDGSSFSTNKRRHL